MGRFDGSEADDRVFVQAQKMLVTSPDVLAEVFRDSDLQNITTVMNQADPAAWLLHATRVELFEDARLLRVSVAGVNPEQQARLVNAIASKYIKRTKDWLDSSHQETIKALSQFKSALTTSLAEARTRLKEAEAKNEDFAMIEALRDRIASSLEFWKQVTLSLERAEFVESLNRTVSLRVLARPPTRIVGK